MVTAFSLMVGVQAYEERDDLKLVIHVQRHGNRESSTIFNHLIDPEHKETNFKDP